MSVSTPDVIILHGAPGVGKSTLAKELSKHFPKGVRLEVDTLRSMVISVDWTNQHEHKDLLEVAARLTCQFLELGFKPVIVVDTFSGDKVKPFLKAIVTTEHTPLVKTYALHASPDVLSQRLAARHAELFRDIDVSKKLNSDDLKISRPDDTLLDTSALSAPQIAELILEGLESASHPSGGGRGNSPRK